MVDRAGAEGEMLPKPWIIDTDEDQVPSRPRPRVSDNGIWEEAPADESASEPTRGVEIVQISPSNPHEIAI